MDINTKELQKKQRKAELCKKWHEEHPDYYKSDKMKAYRKEWLEKKKAKVKESK